MPSPPDTTAWQLRSRALDLTQPPVLMGIVNVTPDSFSDGGRFFAAQNAIDHALRLLDEGAAIVDIGGESTRPGSPAGTPEAIAQDEEKRRVLPVIEGVLRARPDAIVSVDTYRAETARSAVEAGAEIVNDVSGMLWDDAMAKTCAQLGCGVVVMHTRGLPSTWRSQPPIAHGEVASVVLRELQERVGAVLAAGVQRSRIAVDPGFGFGKLGSENDELLSHLSVLRELGLPLVVGVSRKGFLGGVDIAERDARTYAAGLTAVQRGAQVLRVHDVRGSHLNRRSAR